MKLSKKVIILPKSTNLQTEFFYSVTEHRQQLMIQLIIKITKMPQELNRDYRTGWFGVNITHYILYLDTVWHLKDQNYLTRMPAASTKLYSVDFMPPIP